MTTQERIQARMNKLQAQAEALIAKRVSGVLDDIRALMEKHGLTTADIDAHFKGKKRRLSAADERVGNGKSRPADGTKGKLPPKYINPKTGETWSGHARPPAWIKDVKDRSKFLIDGAGAATDAVVVSKVSTTKKAIANKAASKQVAVKKSAAKKATVGTKKPVSAKTAAKQASTKQAALAAVKKAPAKRVLRMSAVVTAPAGTVESGTESTT